MDAARSIKLPTPDLSHFTSASYSKVYEPAEDTFLILDSLEEECVFLKSRDPVVCFEIGSGSGCVITFLAMMLGSSRLYLSSDINPAACLATVETGRKNHCQIHSVNQSFFGSLEESLVGQIDVLIFNPPYVPTDEDELGRNDIVAAWAGGEDGRVVIDQLLPKKMLSPEGVFYLFLIRENRPAEVARILEDAGLEYRGVVLQRQAMNEHQKVLKFVKPS